MRILLVCPPYSASSVIFAVLEPLGLEILAATVPEHDVRIVDLRFEPASALDELLATFRPHLVGATVNSTVQVNPTLQIVRAVKETDPRIVNIVGGQHPSLVPMDFYDEHVDAVFIGLAETSFPSYVDAVALGHVPGAIPGVIAVVEGVPSGASDSFCRLDPADIPVPDRSLTAKYRSHYRDQRRRGTASVNTARGCPYRCSFCACWKSTGGQYLVRAAEDVFAELTALPEESHHVHFCDDNTFSKTERAEELCRLIRESDLGKTFSGFARTDTIVKHPDLFRRWREVGLDTLTIGFEAIDDAKLKSINKKNSAEKNREAARILNELDINIWSYFLVDPGFQEEDFRKLLEYVARHNLVTPVFSMLTPFPGTELYEQKKSAINLGYDFFDCVHWVYPSKTDNRDFFDQYYDLWTKTYSFGRHFKLFAQDLASRLGFAADREKRRYLSVAELILVRSVLFNTKRKLRKSYRLASA